MTKEDWEFIEDIVEVIHLRFRDYDLEIDKLKFSIKQLEKSNDERTSTSTAGQSQV